jgi:hypothetical protein
MKTIDVNEEYTDVLFAVASTYADCRPDIMGEDHAYRTRKLMWRAARAVPRDAAKIILQRCIPEGYNAFEANLLDLLPADCQVEIAREYSVCIYVQKALKEIPDMLADEWHVEGDVTRIWWD